MKYVLAAIIVLSFATVASAQDETDWTGGRHPGGWEWVWQPGHYETRTRTEYREEWVREQIVIGWEWREIVIQTSSGGPERYDPATDTYAPSGRREVIRLERVPVYEIRLVRRLVPHTVTTQVWIPGRWVRVWSHDPVPEYIPLPAPR
ncbi:MAG: hypothetical protein NUW37_15075 [Planctomycetes bacterium]|nr:hypothetical protein [Planctomycetota bacterium]